MLAFYRDAVFAQPKKSYISQYVRFFFSIFYFFLFTEYSVSADLILRDMPQLLCDLDQITDMRLDADDRVPHSPACKITVDSASFRQTADIVDPEIDVPSF